ncbi:hypothetical protein SCAR479_13666 [Seiridium cardinale]|uniref:Uncharacterized protein n=1 Tax=Seiridium cardinale TaxID=138064 RepID=A0ABR2X7B9_9PEZI
MYVPVTPSPQSCASRSLLNNQPIYLRACHSPWHCINPHVLTVIRLLVTGYLISVAGVSMKYKLEIEDSHTRWRIPFQFSTVTFVLLLAYNLQVTLWTIMHLLFPHPVYEDAIDGYGNSLGNKLVTAMSPPGRATSPQHRFVFSLFYTVAHVFTIANTIIYWAILVPSGHGGFKAPSMSHPNHPPKNQTAVLYDPDKGLFEEGGIKAFSIISVWTMTTVIALLEVMFFNSIRRQTPVAGHVASVILASGAYLAWAGIGRLLTGHAGLFFLDPAELGNVEEATIAASLAFLALTPGIFSYMYGLIAMRESMTAHHGAHGSN